MGIAQLATLVVTDFDDIDHQLFDAIDEKFKTVAQEAEKETIEGRYI